MVRTRASKRMVKVNSPPHLLCELHRVPKFVGVHHNHAEEIPARFGGAHVNVMRFGQYPHGKAGDTCNALLIFRYFMVSSRTEVDRGAHIKGRLVLRPHSLVKKMSDNLDREQRDD